MIRVGLTGGIGSGKTLVSDQFQSLGVPVIDTDNISRLLTSQGSPVLIEIKRALGSHFVNAGELDRDALRKHVFQDARERGKLEAILHPRIQDEVNHRVSSLDAPYCVIVVPLMFETDFKNLVDRVLVVEAPRDKRIRWIANRDHLSVKDIERIMNAQASDEQRAEIADDIIRNDGDITALLKIVNEYHQWYSQLASSRGDTPKTL